MKEKPVPSPITGKILVSRCFNEPRVESIHTIRETKSSAKALILMKADTTCDSNKHRINIHLRDRLIDVAEEMVNQLFLGDNAHTEVHEQYQLPILSEFIETVVRRTNTSVASILTALTYLFRLKQRYPGCKGTHGSGHRLLLASIMIATKYLHDDAYYNKTWASACNGIFTIQEINRMEMELLFFLNFKLYVSTEHWSEFVTLIEGKLSSSGKYSAILSDSWICIQDHTSNGTTHIRGTHPSVEPIKLDCTQLPANLLRTLPT